MLVRRVLRDDRHQNDLMMNLIGSILENNIVPDLPKTGVDINSSSLNGGPKARSISSVLTGVPVMTGMVQQPNQMTAEITVPNFIILINL
jgi:hypothetical protein